MSKPDYKGHKSLACMVSTHMGNWRQALAACAALHEMVGDESNASWFEHELKALQDIEDAVNEELKNV